MKIKGKQLEDTLRTASNPFTAIYSNNIITNLDQGKILIGDSNDKSSQSAYTLPLSDGTNGQVLTTNGNGVTAFSDIGTSGMTVETKTANFSAVSNYFYLVSTTAGSTIQVTVPSQTNFAVGDRIKVFNTGAGTVRIIETISGTSIAPSDSNPGVYGSARSVNSKGLIELVALTTSEWSYVLIPQIEIDSGTLTNTGEFLIYKSSELALKPAPYAMPDTQGDASQLLAVSSTTSQLEFIDTPNSSSLAYEDLTSGATLTINSTTGFKNYRLRHNVNSSASNTTITLPRVVTGYSSGFYYPISWLNGKIMEIVNESNANISLYISDVKEASNKNYAQTRVFTSAGQVSPSDGAYTHTVGPRSRVYVAASYSVSSGSSSSANLDYTIIEAGNTGSSDLSTDSSPQLGGDLDVNGRDIISASNGDIELAPNGSGAVKIKGNTTSGSGRLVLNCEDNSHGITLKGPPHSAAASYTLTFPNTDGNANQVLKTDGSGGLDWVDQASGGGWTYSAITADPANAQAGYHYSCTGTFTITLPTSGVSAGAEIRIKNMGSGTITIDPQTQNIDGLSNDYTLDVQYSAITLVSTGSHWEII